MAVLRTLAIFQDKLSRAGFILASCVLAFISAAYCFEIVSRYFFNRPTIWVSPLVSYGLCIAIFLALPDLTRRGQQVSIDLHEAWLTPRVLGVLLKVTRLASGIFCLAAAWITGRQAWSEYVVLVWTNSYVPIPKWWLFVFISYGLFSGGIYFLRQACGEQSHSTEQVIQ